MFLFRVIGWQMYRPRPPTSEDKFKSADVTLIIPTIDTDEEAMHEAMRSWVLNEPYEILIVTVGEHLQKELQQIASTSLAADITRVLYVEKPANKRIQLVRGTFLEFLAPLLCTDTTMVWASTKGTSCVSAVCFPVTSRQVACQHVFFRTFITIWNLEALIRNVSTCQCYLPPGLPISKGTQLEDWYVCRSAGMPH